MRHSLGEPSARAREDLFVLLCAEDTLLRPNIQSGRQHNVSLFAAGRSEELRCMARSSKGILDLETTPISLNRCSDSVTFVATTPVVLFDVTRARYH